jgi:hypothetical protein
VAGKQNPAYRLVVFKISKVKMTATKTRFLAKYRQPDAVLQFTVSWSTSATQTCRINLITMNKHIIRLLPVIFFLISGCTNNRDTKKGNAPDTLKAGVHTKPADTAAPNVAGNKPDTLQPGSNMQPFVSSSKLSTGDYIKQYPAYQHAELRRLIERLRKEWQNRPNPLTATYQGNDFGDYHHILFRDANGTTYDFGQANNHYGPYQLHARSGQYDDNPEYLGKKFKIYWDWILTDFSCCDGEYGKAKAYLPSIIKLELVQ